MENTQTTVVDGKTVSCDGGGALGHPKVFLRIPDNETEITCPYCSCRFVLEADRKVAAGH